MARFKYNATVTIEVDAEDQKKARKLAWTLMTRRVESQQFGYEQGNYAEVKDWELDEDGQEAGQQDNDNNQNARGDDDNDTGNQGGSRRGFAAMDPEKRSEIAAMGGRASHGGSGSGGGRGSNRDEGLQAMQQLLNKPDLTPQGRREIEEAIEKHKRGELTDNNNQRQ